MAWDYSEKVKEHFLHPRNVGKIQDADGIGEVGSIACGDALTLYLKVEPETDRIRDAKFETFGCGSAIASSSALTEMIRGLTLDQAAGITNQQIAEYLDGLPAEKMHCSVMGREALEAAIANYRGLPPPHEAEHEEGEIVCHCFGVSRQKIERAIEENKLKTVEQVTNYTKAGGGCSSCHEDIEEILQRFWAQEKPKPQKQQRRLTNLQRINMIQDVIENEIRPLLQRDGGNIELVDVDGSEVQLAFSGQCLGCKASDVTRNWIEERLRDRVTDDIVVSVVPLEEVA